MTHWQSITESNAYLQYWAGEWQSFRQRKTHKKGLGLNKEQRKDYKTRSENPGKSSGREEGSTAGRVEQEG